METEKEPLQAQVDTDKELLDKIGKQFSAAQTAQKESREDGNFPWSDREDLFRGLYKHPEEKTKSSLSTGELSTIIIDAHYRVMAQLPSGRFYNYNGNPGANLAMNLLMEHWVLPNANTGGSVLLKHRQTCLYSSIFPYSLTYVDWRVKAADKDYGYTGPDPIPVHPNRFYPQPGKSTIQDMDYCFIDTEVSKEWLTERGKAEVDGVKVWKNVDKVLENHKDDEGVGTPEVDRSNGEKGKKKTGITLRHQFLKDGTWRVYAPFEDNKGELLVNEKEYYTAIPVFLNSQLPLIDTLEGYNTMERGQQTQKSMDSVVRMNLEGYAISINPPVMVDPKRLSYSSVIMQAGATWMGEMGSAQVMNVNPNAMATFQGTYGTLKGNLLSLGAQQDTSVSKTVDTGMGKTPEAIRAQGDKMGVRDTGMIFMMEQYIEQLYTFMADMIVHKGIEDYTFNLFGGALKKIQDQYPEEDLKEFLNGSQVSIPLSKIKGNYRYEIEVGSTSFKKDDTGQQLLSFIEIYNKYPGIAEDFAAAGQKFNQGEAFKRAFIDSGVQDADKIIVTQESPESLPEMGSEGSTLDNQSDMQQPMAPPEELMQAPVEATEAPMEQTLPVMP